jgi:hypothetical protein
MDTLAKLTETLVRETAAFELAEKRSKPLSVWESNLDQTIRRNTWGRRRDELLRQISALQAK